MAEQENFRGFFSYARDDGETDPVLITALTTELQGRINARLVNERLTIWRDTERLKTGERWDETIEGELRRADFLIVLLTPRWIGSEYCRKEFALFEELEASRGSGQCVVPILARPVAPQERRLTPEQRDVYSRINRRQHFQALAVDFLKLPSARRRTEIDKLAEHIAGIIEQLTDFPRPTNGLKPLGVGSALVAGFLGLPSAEASPGGDPQGSDAERPDFAVFRDMPFMPELVVIPSGEFMMGSVENEEGRFEYEEPRHRVTIDHRFGIGRYPVTSDEYDRFCEATQRKKPGDEGWGRDRRPVINVSWEDAQEYLA